MPLISDIIINIYIKISIYKYEIMYYYIIKINIFNYNYIYYIIIVLL